jgi:hypothetical protein
MANINEVESGRRPPIKLHPKDKHILRNITLGGLGVATSVAIGIGVDKLIKNYNNNSDPNHGIIPITTDGTMPSQETTVPTTEKPTETTPRPTTEETTVPTTEKQPIKTTTAETTETEVKIEATDLTDYGITFNKKTEKYENASGEVVGYPVEEVYISGEQKKGSALIATEIEKIIDKQLEEKNKIGIPIPVDPKDGQIIRIEYGESIYEAENITRESTSKKPANSYLLIKTNKEVDLINPFYGENNLLLLNSTLLENGIRMQGYICSSSITNNPDISEKEKLMFFTLLGKFNSSVHQLSLEFESKPGEKLDTFNKQFYLYFSLILNKKISLEDLLTTSDGSPFFIANFEE